MGRHSTARPKPAKPRKDFPLYPHSSGQWAKKVRGKMHYFGVWEDPVAAEKAWERDKFALMEGRKPGDVPEGDTLGWLINTFMDAKQDGGEVAKSTLADYHDAVKHLANALASS